MIGRRPTAVEVHSWSRSATGYSFSYRPILFGLNSLNVNRHALQLEVVRSSSMFCSTRKNVGKDERLPVRCYISHFTIKIARE